MSEFPGNLLNFLQMSKFSYKKKTTSKSWIIPVATGLALTALGAIAFSLSRPTPKKTAEAFMKAMENRDDAKAGSYWCRNDASTLFSVSDWKFIREDKVQAQIPLDTDLPRELQQEVSAIEAELPPQWQLTYYVDSSNRGGSEISKDWIVEVYRTKDRPQVAEILEEKIEEFSRRSDASNDPRGKHFLELLSIELRIIAIPFSYTQNYNAYCINAFRDGLD